MIHQLSRGASPATEESDAALVALNAMIDQWRTESLMCYARREESLTTSASDGSYTIGASGDLNTVRPMEIEAVYVIDSGGFSHELRELTDAEYVAVLDKTHEADLPTHYNYKASYPQGTLILYPVPSGTLTVKVLVKVPFAAVALTDTVAVPPGWEDGLASNLAVRLGPEYETSAPEDVQRMAVDTKAYIKRANIRPLRMVCDVAGLSSGASASNIQSDE